MASNSFISKAVDRYLIKSTSGMAQGLFASLLIGTIINTLGQQLAKVLSGGAEVADFLVQAGAFAMEPFVVGGAMAVGIGVALGSSGLVLFSLVTVGAVCNDLGGAGGPLSVLIIAIVANEMGSLVSKKTRIDILVTPIVTVLVGVLLALVVAKPIGQIAMKVGDIIQWATKQHPFIMGIVVSIVVGVALTLPISSAAICAAFSVTGLAGGAALAGCCCNMVGFAVISFKENGVGGFVSQALGTSMLQMPNIIRNPRVWIPAIVASAITGPISTCLFKLQLNGAAIASGMGTCGLVGPIGVITGWASPSKEALANGVKHGVLVAKVEPGVWEWVALAVVCFVLPAVISLAVQKGCVKLGWIKDGDLSLQREGD